MALKKVGERVLAGLAQDNVLILQNTHMLQSLVTAAAEEAKSFLSQSQVRMRRRRMKMVAFFLKVELNYYISQSRRIRKSTMRRRRTEEGRTIVDIR